MYIFVIIGDEIHKNKNLNIYFFCWVTFALWLDALAFDTDLFVAGTLFDVFVTGTLLRLFVRDAATLLLEALEFEAVFVREAGVKTLFVDDAEGVNTAGGGVNGFVKIALIDSTSG
jgi:hypothetical protein